MNMNHSENIASIAGALSKAQGEIQNASKNAKNPHFKSSYADLAEVLNTIRPVFAKHGLSIVQMPALTDNVASVETMILHESGEWISGISSAPLGGRGDAQAVGSATTYLRRYSAAALACIAQEDDDGNTAAKATKANPAEVLEAVNNIGAAETMESLAATFKAAWQAFADTQSRQQLTAAKDARKKELQQ